MSAREKAGSWLILISPAAFLLLGCEPQQHTDNRQAVTERAVAAEAEARKREYARDRAIIHADIERLLAEGRSKEAIERGAPYAALRDGDLTALVRRAQDKIDKEKEKQLLAEVKATKPTDHFTLMNKHMELERLDPSNKNYRRQWKKHSAALDRIAQDQAKRGAGPFRPGQRSDASIGSPGAGDIDKLTTYAVVIGRATACGADTRDASRRVGAWMDRKFPPGSEDQRTYLPIFMNGVVQHAQLQKAGNSPDSCSTVFRMFNGFNWP